MRIDDDDRKVSLNRRIDLIRRIQDEQENLNAKAAKSTAGTKHDSQASQGAEAPHQAQEKGLQQADVKQATKKASEVAHAEVTAQVRRAEVMHHEVTGTEKSAQAVDAAHKQQSRGEDWQKFAPREETQKIPESVEALAQAEKQKDAEREERERQSVREILNDMAVKNRMIKG